MDPEPASEPRRLVDRRRAPTGPWDALRLRPGRRRGPRRADERSGVYYVDRFDGASLALILLFLGLSLLDGLLTLRLLDEHCEEVNPLMHYLLRHGPLAFMLGKYALTALGLPLLLVFRRHRLFGSPVRAGHLIPMFVGLYLALIGYQIGLLHRTGLAGPPASASASASAAPPGRAVTTTYGRARSASPRAGGGAPG